MRMKDSFTHKVDVSWFHPDSQSPQNTMENKCHSTGLNHPATQLTY